MGEVEGEEEEGLTDSKVVMVEDMINMVMGVVTEMDMVMVEVTEMDTVTEVDMINMEEVTTILVMDREDTGSKVMDKVVKMDMEHREDTELRVMEPKILVVEKLQEDVVEVVIVEHPINLIISAFPKYLIMSTCIPHDYICCM